MRNLKKFFAVVVAVAMMVTAMAPAFAAETAVTTGTTVAADTAAKLADKIGMLKGQGDGVTEQYLATTPTRLQSIIMFLRLKGLEEEALKFTGTESFNDAEDIDWDGGKAIAAYVKANGSTLGIVGTPEGNLEPNAPMTAQAYYKVMLEALGYAQKVDFEWEDTIKFAGEKGLKEVASVASFTVNSLAIATVETLKATTKDGKGTLASQLIKDADLAKEVEAFVFAQAGEATFVELTAKTASSFALKFAGSVDTKNIVATVKRGPIDVTLTPVWSENNTVLTLSTDGKLVTGDYTVNVKNGEKDLGSKTITVSEEKLAKIEITSDTLVRYVDEGLTTSTEDDTYYAEANYKAYNQYGDDVTEGSLASGINWYCTLPNVSISATKGDIKFTSTGADAPFRTDKYYLYKEAVITANETTSAISTSKTLKISDTFGNIGEIKLIKATNPDGATMRINAPETFYIEYEIKDVNGNPITSYDILKNSITFNVSNEAIIQPVEFEEDTIDSDKGVIVLKFKTDCTYTYDSLVTVSAFSKYSGKSASINLDVKKAVAVTKFTLQSPAQEVAAEEEVLIPFVAYDQDGALMTEDVLKDVDVNISGPSSLATYTKDTSNNVDKLYAQFPVDGTYTITANVRNTGNFSQMTVNVRRAAVPTSLKAIDTSVILPAIAYNGVIMADFVDYPAFTVLDQYDRVFDLSKKFEANGVTYGITAVPSSNGVNVEYVKEDGITSSGKNYINGTDKIKITGAGVLDENNNIVTLAGSLNVKFALVAIGKTAAIDERNISIRVVEDKDIEKFEFRDPNALMNLYNFNSDNTTVADATYYRVNAEVVGVISGGVKVAIPNDSEKIRSMTSSNNVNFSDLALGEEDGVDVYKIGAVDKNEDNVDVEATLTAFIMNDGKPYSITTKIKALTARPEAKTIAMNADYAKVKQQIGDTFIMTETNAKILEGKKLDKSLGAPVWFEVTDQYGEKVLAPVYDTGAIASVTVGGSYDVTAVTENGLTKTVTIRVVADED